MKAIDKHIVEANVKLLDENSVLKDDKRILNLRVEEKDKVINDLLSRIATLEYEVERLENKIQKAIEILENKKHCERLFGGVEEKSFTEQALDILDKVGDKE